MKRGHNVVVGFRDRGSGLGKNFLQDATSMNTNANDKIQFACNSCNTRMAVAAAHAGKMVKCRCGQQVTVPTMTQTARPIAIPNPARANPAPQNDAAFVSFSCKGCQSTLRVRAADAGKACRCRCGATLTIPASSIVAMASQNNSADPTDKLFDMNFGGGNLSPMTAPPSNPYAPTNPHQMPIRASLANSAPPALGSYNAPQADLAPAPAPAPSSGMWEERVFNGSIWGGIAAMAAAVIWFVVGLACGYIFFYPPILFVIGLVGLIRGLMGED